MRDKRLFGTVICLFCFIFLTACSIENDNEIAFINPFVGADADNFQNMIDAYNATEPEFPIRNVAMEQDAMYTSISTAYPTGTGIPDLAIVHAERIQNFVQNDMLRSLDNLLVDFPSLTANNYRFSLWNSFRYPHLGFVL